MYFTSIFRPGSSYLSGTRNRDQDVGKFCWGARVQGSGHPKQQFTRRFLDFSAGTLHSKDLQL